MKRWRAAAIPYLLILPGGLWLVIFFAIPVIVLISLSTQQGNIVDGFSQTFHFGNYATAWDNYHDQFIRSLLYGGIATILCIALGYPVAYWIAFRGGAAELTPGPAPPLLPFSSRSCCARSPGSTSCPTTASCSAR